MVVNYPPDAEGVKKKVIELKESLEINDKMKKEVRRGEKSWNYFVIAYMILLALTIGITSVLEIEWRYKVMLILFGSVVFLQLCFFNGWFRNKIVGIMSKSQEKVEGL